MTQAHQYITWSEKCFFRKAEHGQALTLSAFDYTPSVFMSQKKRVSQLKYCTFL
jgi:hypothetical protein